MHVHEEFRAFLRAGVARRPAAAIITAWEYRARLGQEVRVEALVKKLVSLHLVVTCQSLGRQLASQL